MIVLKQESYFFRSFKAAFDEVLQESPANLYGAYNDRISCDQFYSIQSLDQPNVCAW